MAFRDYIICGECETKIIYDGYDNGRDRLEELWGDPKADFWTVHLLCPDCLKKLRAERDEARALLRESNEMLAEAIVCGPKLRKYMPLRSRINATLKGDAK